MIVLAAPDKFRGTASASRVAASISRAAHRQGWEAVQMPLSDGGEGFLDVYGRAIGAVERRARVTGPLGAPVEARWGISGQIAVIEMALASGLELVGGAKGNEPLRASTQGTGELINAAASAGAKTIVVGCGGSATTDGGKGALSVMGHPARFAGIELVVACDVTTGFLEAADRFAGQKGATPAQVRFLSRRLAALAERYRHEQGAEVTGLAGGGAAGGLAGGLASLGARLVPGFELVSEAVGLAESVAGADLVVTGEGFLDAESLDGKVVGSVAALAGSTRTPLVAVVGESFTNCTFPVLSLVERCGREKAIGSTEHSIEETVAAYLGSIPRPGAR